jgi:hypothetical protein
MVTTTWDPPIGAIFPQFSPALRPRGDDGKIAAVESATRHHLCTAVPPPERSHPGAVALPPHAM